MLFAEAMSSWAIVQLLLFLSGLSILFYIVVFAIGPHVGNEGWPWHHGPAVAMGVDAAEKGDNRRLLLGKVPYELQKRAILHKVIARLPCRGCPLLC